MKNDELATVISTLWRAKYGNGTPHGYSFPYRRIPFGQMFGTQGHRDPKNPHRPLKTTIPALNGGDVDSQYQPTHSIYGTVPSTSVYAPYITTPHTILYAEDIQQCDGLYCIQIGMNGTYLLAYTSWINEQMLQRINVDMWLVSGSFDNIPSPVTYIVHTNGLQVIDDQTNEIKSIHAIWEYSEDYYPYDRFIVDICPLQFSMINENNDDLVISLFTKIVDGNMYLDEDTWKQFLQTYGRSFSLPADLYSPENVHLVSQVYTIVNKYSKKTTKIENKTYFRVDTANQFIYTNDIPIETSYTNYHFSDSTIKRLGVYSILMENEHPFSYLMDNPTYYDYSLIWHQPKIYEYTDEEMTSFLHSENMHIAHSLQNYVFQPIRSRLSSEVTCNIHGYTIINKDISYLNKTLHLTITITCHECPTAYSIPNKVISEYKTYTSPRGKTYFVEFITDYARSEISLSELKTTWTYEIVIVLPSDVSITIQQCSIDTIAMNQSIGATTTYNGRKFEDKLLKYETVYGDFGRTIPSIQEYNIITDLVEEGSFDYTHTITVPQSFLRDLFTIYDVSTPLGYQIVSNEKLNIDSPEIAFAYLIGVSFYKKNMIPFIY